MAYWRPPSATNTTPATPFGIPPRNEAGLCPLPIRTLMTMPCADVGVGMTCRSLLRGAVAAGIDISLFTSRSDSRHAEPFALNAFTPKILNALPYPLTRPISNRRLHDEFLRRADAGQIAYLWPSAPVEIYAALQAKGVPIVTEAINTLMSDARPILDAAYAELGLRPRHGITDARITAEQERLALSTAIFSPSPATDQSLARSGVADRIIASSYGTWVPPVLPDRPVKPDDAPVTFLFIGTSAIRKGLHHLLAAWRGVPANARLRIIGLNDPDIPRLFGDVLDQPNVVASGFSPNVAAEYRLADVFLLPSLEEGDPIVTYEAAAHGLPILASPMGAGRIGAETGAVDILDTSDPDQFRDRIARFAGSKELRQDWAARAREAVLAYDWTHVAPRRFAALSRFLGAPRR
jgi:glycosyltransferase involved in cell wall biosynthesis